MLNLSVNEIREKWINFFVSKKHHYQNSASLVPVNDSSLLWINSGVAGLKKYFDGSETPINPRIVNSQKSLRTNDIEKVGISARHHTFFEMLGNFSIGAYFKQEALELAFEFLTQDLKMDVNKLYISVYKDDNETYEKWINLGINKTNIIKCGKDRNFWEIGEGPSGPCTEIFYDRGDRYDPNNIGKKLFIKDIENDRYIEIWNIVFSQFYHDGNGNFSMLERKNIDTGAGLERLACVLQQVPTSFETDYFMPIIEEISKYTKLPYSKDVYFWKKDQIDHLKKYNKQININTSFKIIADHIRASVLAISDGVLPSNKDRGYIIRRLIRRSIVNAKKLNIDDLIMSKLVGVIVQLMGQHYFELKKKQPMISKIIQDEEIKFSQTITKGLKMIKSHEGKIISAKDAFKLFDTYGFPIDLTIEYANENNKQVDLKGFEIEFQKHQEVSKSKTSNSDSMSAQKSNLLNFHIESFFHYDKSEMNSKIIGCFDENFNQVSEFNTIGWLILDQTCFYAESGGQVSDTGEINGYQVIDVQKAPNGQHMHLVEGHAQIGENANIKIDLARRNEISKNHTCAHLIHQGISEKIVKDAQQQGAYYDDKKVRFDYFAVSNPTKTQILELEAFVNEKIKEKINREIFHITLAKAREMGAVAQFAEKYGEYVRVVKFGHSITLCGGTHVLNTATIGQFMVQKTESKGAGIFRIEGIIGKEKIKEQITQKFIALNGEYQNIKSEYANVEQPSKTIESLLASYTQTPTPNNWRKQIINIDLMKKEMHKLLKHQAQLIAKNKKFNLKIILLNSIQKISTDLNLIIHHTTLYDANIFREVAIEIKNEVPSTCIIGLIETNNSNMYIISVSDNITKQYPAGGIMNYLNNISHGKGGGSPKMAQGHAGDDINLCRKAVEKVEEMFVERE